MGRPKKTESKEKPDFTPKGPTVEIGDRVLFVFKSLFRGHRVHYAGGIIRFRNGTYSTSDPVEAAFLKKVRGVYKVKNIREEG